jgi:nucleolar protein 58
MSRVLANKCALSIRVDALGDKDTPNIGIENREKVESRLRQLEGREIRSIATPKQTKFDKYSHSRSAADPSTVRSSSLYNDAADAVATPSKKDKKKDKKKKDKKADGDEENGVEQVQDEEVVASKKDKKKKNKNKDKSQMDVEEEQEAAPKKSKDKKKKKRTRDESDESDDEVAAPKKHKKSKKSKE